LAVGRSRDNALNKVGLTTSEVR